jgi:hypothetical protein
VALRVGYHRNLVSQTRPLSGTPPRRSDTVLVIIDAFKLPKGLLLVAVGIGWIGKRW